MRDASVVLAVTVGLLSMPIAGQTPDCGRSPENGWKQFLDKAHGLCFWYSPVYTIDHERRSAAQNKDGEVIVTLRTTSLPRGAHGDDKFWPAITVLLYRENFELRQLSVHAPTGEQQPPAINQFGPNKFYYYGKGGGGVAYPDVFYFNLRGQVLK